MPVHAHQPDDRTDRVIAVNIAKGMDLLLAGDGTHAASHFADAIVADPARPEAYEHLAAMASTLAEFDAIVDGDLAMYTGIIAGRAALSARLGDLHEALRQIATCSASDPVKPWTRTPWWPRLADITDPRRAAQILKSLSSIVAETTDRQYFAPYLQLARDLADRHPDDVDVAWNLCAIADAMHASDEADAWCTRATMTSGRRDALTTMAIWSRMRRGPGMAAAWTALIEADPDRLDAYVELACALALNGRRRESDYWIARALERDPAHLGARSLRHALAYKDSGDVRHLIAVVDDARTGGPADASLPDTLDAILTMVCDTKTWLNRVPMPTEVTAIMANEFARRRSEGDKITVQRSVLTAIEPASAEAAANAITPGLVREVMACPEPDLRVPIADGTYHVWRYEGTTAVPVAPPPTDATVTMFLDVANPPWWHPAGAYERASALGRVPLDELLGLLGHMPASPRNARWNKLNTTTITYWPRLAAAWACLGILHHRPDEPWATSTRRLVLVDLVNGIEDWTTDSAIFALIVAAWMEPGVRDDVRSVVRARLDEAIARRRRRLMTIAPSIAELMLITPGCTEQDRAASRDLAALTESAEVDRAPASPIKKIIGRLKGR